MANNKEPGFWRGYVWGAFITPAIVFVVGGLLSVLAGAAIVGSKPLDGPRE